MQGRTLAVVVILLTGCATTPKPVLNDEPIEIANDEVADYWVARQSGVTVRAPSGGSGCIAVEIRYLIDSNGAVHDVEVLGAEPNDRFNRTAIEVQESFSYEPSESNTERTPVRVRRYVTFDLNRSDEDNCEDYFESVKQANQT